VKSSPFLERHDARDEELRVTVVVLEHLHDAIEIGAWKENSCNPVVDQPIGRFNSTAILQGLELFDENSAGLQARELCIAAGLWMRVDSEIGASAGELGVEPGLGEPHILVERRRRLRLRLRSSDAGTSEPTENCDQDHTHAGRHLF
jgi:hypothetical protein